MWYRMRWYDRGCPSKWEGAKKRWSKSWRYSGCIAHWCIRHGWIKQWSNMVLGSILLHIDSVEDLHRQMGGQTAWIEGMGPSGLGTRHKGLHSLKMRPWFCCKGLEWSVLFESLVKHFSISGLLFLTLGVFRNSSNTCFSPGVWALAP